MKTTHRKTSTPEPFETRDQWHVIGRGKAGWHSKGINVSSSGGDLEPRKWWAGGMTRGYLEDAAPGCLIYDADGADDAAFSHFVFSGPMCNPALAPDAADRFSTADRDTAARMAPGLSGAFLQLAAVAQSEQYSGLDYVGVNIYRELLRQIPGVKIGTVINGKIEWEAQS